MEFLSEFYQNNAFWFLPIMIFVARVADVTIGTLRIVFVSRGLKVLASTTAFFEVLIWLLAMAQIMQNLDSVFNVLAYAGGFATGNYLGLLLEERIAMGYLHMSIYMRKNPQILVKHLRKANFGVTTMNAKGTQGGVRIIITIIKRKNLPIATVILRKYAPEAFVTIDDVRTVAGGVFPHLRSQQVRK